MVKAACELNDMELDAVSGGHQHKDHRPETKYVFKDDTFNITNNGTVNGVSGIALGGQTLNFA